MFQFAAAICVVAVGYVIVDLADEYMETKHQKIYETDFLQYHDKFLKDNPNVTVLPLLFDDQEQKTLMKLCQQYHKRWKIKYFYNKLITKHEPNIGKQNVAFRRLDQPHDSVEVQALRCNKKYAIATVDKSAGFLLKAVESKDRKENEIFYIQTKFEKDTRVKPSKTGPVEPTSPARSVSPERHETSTRDQPSGTDEPTSPADEPIDSDMVLQKIEKEAIAEGKVREHDNSSGDHESDSTEETRHRNGKKVEDDTKMAEDDQNLVGDDKKEAEDDQKISDDEKKKAEDDKKNGDK